MTALGERGVDLDDGRTLGYREYGRRDGMPVIYLHGMPGSRLDVVGLEEDFLRVGARVVAVERPGYGLSSPRRSWGLLDWPEDVAKLADRLGLGRFALIGVSSGGKYVAACAYALPDRVTRAAIIGGLGPPSTPDFRHGLGRTVRITMTLGTRARPLASAYWRAPRWILKRYPQRFLGEFERELSEPDRQILADPSARQLLLDSFRESLKTGVAGVIDDATTQARSWGFELKQIQRPVHLWHGDRDALVPLHHAEHAAEQIPDSELTVLEGKGHLLFVTHGSEVITALLE
jgi:pimeloyl-ACP methyl ester carboxylesterase